METSSLSNLSQIQNKLIIITIFNKITKQKVGFFLSFDIRVRVRVRVRVEIN